MKVLFAASEAAPFVKTGGLGDVAGSLPKILCEKNVDTRVVLPLYKCIPQRYTQRMELVDSLYIKVAWRNQYCGIMKLIEDGVTYYFIDNKYYFGGDKPYDYIHLDAEKFVFFSKAVLSILPTIGFKPDVIHCNDWQTGAVPVLLDTFLDNEFYRGIKTVMTIHNLRFQGRWGIDEIKDIMGIPDYYYTADKLEYFKDANLLKGGLVYANRITTVSDSYAEEIQSPEYGEGLDGIIRARSHELCGIVNGISYTDWNSETDKYISNNYSKKNIFTEKVKNKLKLQEELGLEANSDKMMIGVVSRLTDQKGFDLVACAMDRLTEGGVQLVILGTGDEKYENLFRHYAWRCPKSVAACIYFSNEMSHKIYASCDAFLMPSRFEPCGLSQLISLRYGTVPIVRETGGLKDTVIPYNEYTGEGNGFSFANYDSTDMLNVIYYAMDIYYNRKQEWKKLVSSGMKCDYSWKTSAEKYIALYENVTGLKAAPPEIKKPAAKRTTKKKQ